MTKNNGMVFCDFVITISEHCEFFLGDKSLEVESMRINHENRGVIGIFLSDRCRRRIRVNRQRVPSLTLSNVRRGVHS